jgi:hypothetical protein
MTTPANRFVVGPDAQGRSAVLQRGLTNVQSRERLYWRATLWATEETPVDNTIDGDRSQTPSLGESLQPLPNGLICRALEISPGAGFPMHHAATLDCLTFASIAHRWGFSHLGRFAAAHKAMFGETPLQVLHSAH